MADASEVDDGRRADGSAVVVVVVFVIFALVVVAGVALVAAVVGLSLLAQLVDAF